MLKSGEGQSQLSISVCILTCNRDRLLEPLLNELQEQLHPADEVLVLDTAPADSTRQVVADIACGQIQYHTFTMDRFDFATARNELLRLASSGAVAFIDDDAFPFPNWLAQVRESLQNSEAIGGATVADSNMPQWWDPEINWCIGLSPPGTIIGKPGYYPDTCNMAATRKLWIQNPFAVVSREDRQLYATGREDAEWWMDRRLEGRDVSINFRQAVAHHVHTNRLTWDYVKRRARNDGTSSWLRRPDFEAATAIPWDLAHIAGVVADKIVHKPFDRRYRLADIVWMQRQWGKFLAVWNSSSEMRPRRREQLRQLGRAGVFQANIRIGKAAFKSMNLIRHRGDFPPTAPKRFFVSADCFLGDSILLRRHVKALADTFPDGKVLVSCRFPALMQGLSVNVKAVSTVEASGLINDGTTSIDAAIVPYFPFGDSQLWRNRLSQIGRTFNCDVGFAGRRDYVYARSIVEKNVELHEHENLARLFRLWPLLPTVQPPPPPVTDADSEWAVKTLAAAKITDYILIQFGAGDESKEWPLDCWIPFLKEIGRAIDLPLVITGGVNWKDAGDIAVKEVNHPAGMICTIGDTVGQMMALVRGAKYFVGGCSGPKHLAMAFGVPTFTLYAASEPQRWGAVENHLFHGYSNALTQKLSGMELQGLPIHHRIRLLQPEAVAEVMVRHYQEVKLLVQQGPFSA